MKVLSFLQMHKSHLAYLNSYNLISLARTVFIKQHLSSHSSLKLGERQKAVV